jgi:2-keto-4-pentenoate hydratase
MSQNEVESLARELLTAYETGQSVPVLASARPGFDLNAAYEVEAALKRLRKAEGVTAVGRKVGYANRAMLRVLKLDTLVWAHMYNDTVHYSDDNSATLTLPNRRALKVEPEIVFGVKQPIVAEGLDAIAALESTEWLAMGFEIIDCPFPEWRFQPEDFVASFGLHAALVIGERMEMRPGLVATLAEQLARFKVRVSKNGEFVEEGSGRNCQRSPALCLAELGAAIARRFPAEPLRGGEVVSSGTRTAGHPTDKGDLWKVEGLSLPALTLHMT